MNLAPKVTIPAIIIAAAQAAAAFPAVSSPRRIAFGSLGASDAPSQVSAGSTPLLLQGLTDDGLISITDIPSFRETKTALLSQLHSCIMAIDAEGDIGVPTQRFADGTIRRSFATSNLPDGGPQPIKTLDEYEALSGQSMSASCKKFRGHLSNFRSSVDLAMKRFAERLSKEMGASLPRPLLSTPKNSVDYEDINQVVAGGEHLEHFHSYQKNEGAVDGDDEATIEFHTDQGFFIAFTPGLIVSSDPSEESAKLSDGFYIQDSNGEKHLMEFTEDDELVFMMGDGVNQFINNKLKDDRKVLRATPHALTLPIQDDKSQARVWYGRMVLPPKDAYVPGMDSTFGEARQFLVDSTQGGGSIPLGIGCSSPTSKAVTQTSRHLSGPEDEVVCAEDELFCWFRCMKLGDYGVTEGARRTTEGASITEHCSQRNLGLQCVNIRGQVLEDGKGHGDYYPECTNSTHLTHPVTAYPEIDQQDGECTSDLWKEFNDDGIDYDFMADLTVPNGSEALLHWSVVTDDQGTEKVKARLTMNNVFGWIAMGLANLEEGAGKNGMNGANVIMAIPGDPLAYSPVTGLDMSTDASVNSYKIHDKDSSFRLWMTPLESADATGSAVESTDCFTALTFETDHINGVKFNLDGTDELIRASNSEDYYVGYHGRLDRTRFTLNWKTGEMSFYESPPAPWEIASNGDTSTNGDTATNGDGQYPQEIVEGTSDGPIKSVFLGAYISFALAAMMLG